MAIIAVVFGVTFVSAVTQSADGYRFDPKLVLNHTGLRCGERDSYYVPDLRICVRAFIGKKMTKIYGKWARGKQKVFCILH